MHDSGLNVFSVRAFITFDEMLKSIVVANGCVISGDFFVENVIICIATHHAVRYFHCQHRKYYTSVPFYIVPFRIEILLLLSTVN